MKNTARALALGSAAAVMVAACAEPPAETDNAAENSDFTPCMVTDSGGVDDRSFNQTAHKGLVDASKELGTAEPAVLESAADADYVPNIQQHVQGDCGIIATVGFLLAQATGDAALENPDEKFTIVDYGYALPEEQKYANAKNLRPLVFNTAEASYLAGYLAAGMTKTGKVATYGGAPIPTVTIFMDGFWEGVQRYNKDKGADVKLLGWNEETQKGSFTGDFQEASKGKVLSENFIRQGADIILPVAGPVGAGTIAAAKNADGVSVIWVDTDGCESLSQEDCQYILTSVFKAMDLAVQDATTDAVNGEFTNEPYIGTLENEGVGITPYHEFEDDVPDELKQEVESIKQEIIDGEVTITSPAQGQLTS